MKTIEELVEALEEIYLRVPEEGPIDAEKADEIAFIIEDALEMEI